MIRWRRLVALVLLALFVVAPFAASAFDACGADDCPPTCGDCALCGQVAIAAAAVAATAPDGVALALGDPAQRASSVAVRGVEHVPLPCG
jgi:hypothetical protein